MEILMKLLITDDVHIFDYPQYNIDGNRFRLEQFIKLAHRLVEIGKEQSIYHIAFAGDTVHKPVVQPHIQHYVHQFFDIIASHYENIYLILGQHCCNTKFQTQTAEDSFVPLMHDSIQYMDQQVIELDGKTVGFSNWRVNQDWSFIKEHGYDKIDVMIGHLTLSSMFGQDYDDSLYHLGFFGDIHQPVSYGHSHSTNVPIPHYLNDCQDGSIIILDTEDIDNWERVHTESDNFKYLRIYYEDQCPKHLLNNELTVVVKRPEEIIQAKSFHRSLDVKQVIEHVVTDLGFEDYYKELLPVIDYTGHEPLDMSFTLLNIHVTNYRSIDDFKYDFQSGITLICGENGAGKSSLLRALEYVLKGQRTRPPVRRS